MPTIIVIFSVVFLVVGVGCIGWALSNIEAQSRYTDSQPFDVTARTPVDSQTSGQGGGANKASTAQTTSVTKANNSHAARPSAGARIGSLYIPVLGRNLAIVEGTDTEALKKGVGHYSGSVMPGVKDNCVLSGHRDTVLTGLGKVGIGDELIIKTSSGRFIYIVKRIRIVGKNDKTVIVPTTHAVLTLTTCYPFHYIGPAPRRYIVSADLSATR